AVLEYLSPGVLGIAEHGSDKVAHLVGGLAGCLPRRRLIRLLVMPATVHNSGAADQDAWINTKGPADPAKNDDSSDPESPSTNQDTHTADAETAIVTAAVFDIIAAAKIIPTHYEILPKFFSIHR